MVSIGYMAHSKTILIRDDWDVLCKKKGVSLDIALMYDFVGLGPFFEVNSRSRPNRTLTLILLN